MSIAADLYKAVIVLRSDIDLLNEIADRGTDASVLDREAILRRYEGLRRHIEIKSKDADDVMNNVKIARDRFNALELLLLAAPVPEELMKEPTAELEELRAVIKSVRSICENITGHSREDADGPTSHERVLAQVILRKLPIEENGDA